MIRRLFFPLLFLISSIQAFTQVMPTGPDAIPRNRDLIAAPPQSAQNTRNPLLTKYGEMINEETLRDYLTILASDAMEGRFTGSRGQKMAAAFIRNHFKESGLAGPIDGDYYQPIDLYTTEQIEIYAIVGKERMNNKNGLVYYGSTDSEREVTQEIIFAGKGRDADFDGIDVKDKAALVLVDEFTLFSRSLGMAITTARDKGADLVIVVPMGSVNFPDFVKEVEPYAKGTLTMTPPDLHRESKGIFFATQAVAEAMLNTKMDKLKETVASDAKKNVIRTIKPGSITYKVDLDVKTVETENVLGYLEGTDKKDEVVVVTAHYDHVGKNEEGTGDLIYNGADDDGSGTSTVMMLAKVYAQAKKDGNGPRRSMLFMTVTGEEEGLFGSQYYVQNPVFPLANTVVDLNIDMVGRTDPQHEGKNDYVYVIGSDKLSSELHTLSENTNAAYTQLDFDYLYNDENHPERLYYRSDHWNFARNNVPIIFYFDGIHADYHKVTDEVDKIEFDHLAKRAKLVFYTAWEIANRENRIAVDKK